MSGPGVRAARRTTPLAAIEAQVQQRAKDEALDVGTEAGRRRLATLVGDAVEGWRADHRRGVHPVDIADPGVAVDRALRNLLGYGPLEALLDDDDVWEIMVNGPAEIFVKRHRGPSGLHHETFHDEAHVLRTLTKILDDAPGAHRKLDPGEGLQDAQLAGGARIHIVHGELVRGGSTIVNIRRFSGVGITHLGELVDRGTVDAATAAFLAACVRARCSIVFAGAPGSGKTTLLSCCAAELDPSLRVVVAEEVPEADIALLNVAQLQTRAPRPDRPGVDLRRLVAGFLRMAPDVAIVGEVRDREALPLLLTLSSGVTGYTTIHAATARQALTRLRFVAQLADTGSELPMSALNQLVSDSVDLVVHSRRRPDGVEVDEIIAVEDLVGPADGAAFTVTEILRRERPGAPLRWSGAVPVRVARKLADAGLDVTALLGVVGR